MKNTFMSIGVQMKRLLIISTRICNSIILGHPFLVAMVCFCIFLRAYSPFLFSFVVSASPVMVCTAILLGTLLLYGEANVHETNPEKLAERKVSQEISPSLNLFENSSDIFGRNEDLSVDRSIHKRNDGLKKVIGEEKTLLKNNSNKTRNCASLCGYMSLNDEGSHDMELRKRVIEKVERGFDDLEKRRKMQQEIQGIKEVLIDNHNSIIQHMEDDNLEAKNKNRFAEDKERAYLGFLHESSWKKLNDDGDQHDGNNDDRDEDEASDFELENSSNSSSGNILPMFEELHPLLDEETPTPIRISHCGSSSHSRKSQKSNENMSWADDDMMKLVDGLYEDEEDDEKQKQRNVEDEDEVFENESNDNNEEEEEVQGGKEDESKSAIIWTEDDQKNVIDLGALEMERNQRLESLIAKRIAHRNLSMIVERNLIDLDGADFPNNIPSISTRRNPFDYDDDNPGSAPSIFLPRQNPFDLTGDSIEKTSHLKENTFRQEFVPSQHREPLFRRHQSFNVGPSFLGVGNIERREFKWKPHFSLDKNDTEGTINETFQRQLSEASDSKVSSNFETESVSSAIEEKKLSEEDISRETEIISNWYHGSILVEHGSISSEDVESFNTNKKAEDTDLHDDLDGVVENLNNHEQISRLSGLEETNPIEVNISEILLRMEDEECVSRSSLSSSTEMDETIFQKNKESCVQNKYVQNEELSYINHIGEYSSTTDKMSQFEQAYVQTSILDRANSNFEEDDISSKYSNQQLPFDASCKEDLKKQQSWSDKTVVGTSFNSHDESMEINKTKEWFAEETSNVKNANMPETIDPQNSMLENSTSSTPTSSSTSPKSLEDRSSFGENYSDEAYKSLSSEGNLDEDDIKDFNKDLFLELDTIGDLIVKEVSFETQDEQILESRIGSPKFDSLPNDPSLIEIREELIASVVRSSKDIDLNSNAFHVEEIAQEVTDSNKTREQIDIGKDEVLDERYLNGKVAEENSSQDVGNYSNQVLHWNKMELPQPPNSKDVQEKLVDELENSIKVSGDLQNSEVSLVDAIVVNIKEDQQAKVEEELHWFDSSDSLEERNEKEMDYAREED